MGISLNSNGRSIHTESVDTRKVYVDPAAADNTADGLSSVTPKKTIAAGFALLRDGYPDWLLLKRGSVFTEALGSDTDPDSGRWREKNGRSATERMLISTYGTGELPILRATSTTTGAWSLFDAINDFYRLDYLSIMDLDFYASSRDPDSPYGDYPSPAGFTPSAIGSHAPSDGLLIENCTFRWFSTNVSIDRNIDPFPTNRIDNLSIRNNRFLNAYNNNGQRSQGLFLDVDDDLLLEGNCADHNGWHESISGAGATIFNHDFYVAANTAIIRYNTLARASSHGLKLELCTNIIILGNILIDNPLGILVFGADAGVYGSVTYNVYYGGRDIATAPRSNFFTVANVRKTDGLVFSENIATTVDATGRQAAIVLSPDSSDPGGCGINDLTIEDNVLYKQYDGIVIEDVMIPGGTGSQSNHFTNLIVRDNDIQIVTRYLVQHSPAYTSDTWSDNRYYSTIADSDRFYDDGLYSWTNWHSNVDTAGTFGQVTYSDPDRSPGTYNASLGDTATTAALLTAIAENTADNWSTDYKAVSIVNYFRVGFDRSPIGGSMSRSATILATQSGHLKFHHKMDEASGNFVDSSGNLQTFTPAGSGVTYAQAGGFDGAIVEFDGTNGFATRTANPLGGATLPAAFTLMGECKSSTTGDHTILSLGQDASSTPFIELSSITGSSLIFAKARTDGTAQSVELVGSSGTANGVLRHFCYTYDAAAGDGKRHKLYLDGVEVATDNTLLGTMTLDRGGIGCRNIGGGQNQKWQGLVGNIAGWDIALTPTEIATIIAGSGGDTTGPVFLSGSINANGLSGTIITNEAVSLPLQFDEPAPFTLTVNGVARVATINAVSSASFTFTISSVIYQGQTVLSSGDSTFVIGSGIRDGADNPMDEWTNSAMTNNSTEIAPPSTGAGMTKGIIGSGVF